jgi:hypothetical protein
MVWAPFLTTDQERYDFTEKLFKSSGILPPTKFRRIAAFLTNIFGKGYFIYLDCNKPNISVYFFVANYLHKQ